MPRKKFFFDTENETYEITAGGAIFYKYDSDNRLQLLLMTNRNKYEDLGGCVDRTDETIYHTVAREVHEESNGQISQRIITRLRNSPFVVSQKSKYIVFFVAASEAESNLTGADFGDREIHDDFERTIDWIPVDVFLNKYTIRDKLNFRLKNRKVFELVKTFIL